MNRTLLTAATIAGTAALTLGSQAAPFQLDFNHRSEINHQDQAGWETFDPTSDGTANGTANYAGYADLATTGTITITTSNMEFARTGNQGDAAAVDTVGDGSLDEMYYDMIFRNDESTEPQISIAGLKAGTYTITTYHMITDSGTDKTFFNHEVQDADSAAFGQLNGNFEMGNDVEGPTIVTFDVTSNGTDPILIRLDVTDLGPGGTGNWYGYNGLEIDLVPEASSLALLGLGGLLVARRRRG